MPPCLYEVQSLCPLWPLSMQLSLYSPLPVSLSVPETLCPSIFLSLYLYAPLCLCSSASMSSVASVFIQLSLYGPLPVSLSVTETLCLCPYFSFPQPLCHHPHLHAVRPVCPSASMQLGL